MPVQSEEKNTDESTEDLEEYTLPTDGLIIRQMKRDGKVSRRTWAALALMVIIVPVILYLSVRIFHGRRYVVCSLIVVVAAMLPFFMMFEGRKPKAREIMVISVLAAIGVAGEKQLSLCCRVSNRSRQSWSLQEFPSEEKPVFWSAV